MIRTIKRLIILPLLIVSLNAGASNGYVNSALFMASTGWWVVGVPTLITFNKKGVVYDWQRSGVMFSLSQDPVMAMQEIWDLKFKGGVKLKKWHPYVAYEWAGSPINMEAYTVGCYYQFYQRRVKKMGNKYGVTIKAGYETGMIKNQNQKVWTNGISLRGELWLRYWKFNGFGFFAEIDYFTRPELVNPHVQFMNAPWLNGTPSGRLGVFWFLN
jgi:hypothetical protein